jgi:hypothetical protein
MFIYMVIMALATQKCYRGARTDIVMEKAYQWLQTSSCISQAFLVMAKSNELAGLANTAKQSVLHC